MRLYYFTSQTYGLESLRDKRIKIARFTELNDPFDFLGLAVDLPSQRYYLKKAREEADKTNGIICMSTTWQEPLLWGHYADKHKGICLGFDVDDAEWQPVIYRKERPSLSNLGVKHLNEISDEQWQEVSRTKFKAWEYEREYRTLVDLKEPDLVSGLFFHPFSETMKLAQVIVGYRTTASRDVVQRLCEHVGGGVDAFQARPAFKEFNIVKQHDGDRWV